MRRSTRRRSSSPMVIQPLAATHLLSRPGARRPRARRRTLQRWGPLPAMRHRPEDVVEDEVADLVAERLPGILVIAEVLARVDTARCRLIRGLGEALEAPHDAWKAGIRQGEVHPVGAEEIAQDGGG